MLSMFSTFVFRKRVLMEFLITELLFWTLKILIKGIETRLNNRLPYLSYYCLQRCLM